MSSPIQNRIGSVFIPVSNMGRAVDWYSKLLNQPVTQTSHEGAIYDVPMAGETGLLLDSTKPEVRNSSQPLFFFLTENIQSVYEFLRQNAVEIVSQIEDIGSVYTLTFKDPDNNLLMVCQRKA